MYFVGSCVTISCIVLCLSSFFLLLFNLKPVPVSMIILHYCPSFISAEVYFSLMDYIFFLLKLAISYSLLPYLYYDVFQTREVISFLCLNPLSQGELKEGCAEDSSNASCFSVFPYSFYRQVIFNIFLYTCINHHCFNLQIFEEL